MNSNHIILTGPPKPIYSGRLKLGGQNPRGDGISVNNYYIAFNGRPFFGICGEFHFSRCPRAFWEEELLKLKAAGLNAVSTYVFWNHHEEEKGVFDWSGERDVRGFLALCARLGLFVFLRIGPFAHGEARNGGLPDWLYGMPFTVRSNDEGYLKYVEVFFGELGAQVSGMMFGQGGPVIGIQLENEHNAASAPWEFLVAGDYEWVHKGSGGEEHIRALRAMASKAGMEAPLATCTGWDGGSLIENETLPVYGGYCWQPWTVLDGSTHKPTFESVIRDFHEGEFKNSGYTPSSTKGKYPYFCGELGGGMACWYRYRFVVPPESVVAATVTRLAGGCNLLGYYMFRDGTNPVGKHSYLNERVVPKISYNFQAPITEYGQLRPSCRMLRPLFLFLQECGERLCPMGTALASGAENITPEDTETLRWAVRHKDGSGFLFLVNYQDHAQMPGRQHIRLELELPGETLRIPEGRGFALKSGISAVLPFNMDLGGALLKYATAQFVTSIGDENGRTFFFFAPEGMASEYCFDSATLAETCVAGGKGREEHGHTFIAAEPGSESLVELTARNGSCVRICTLTAAQAENLWKLKLWGRERVFLSNADLFARGEALCATRAGSPEMDLRVYPGEDLALAARAGELSCRAEGIFTKCSVKLPERETRPDVRFAPGGKATVKLPADALNGLDDILLRVDYLGSVGNVFIDGRLVADNFCNGEVWEIGLKRFFPDMATQGMDFHVIPYKKGGEVVFEPGLALRHEFMGEETAEIFSIEAVPVYRAEITQTRRLQGGWHEPG